MISLKESILSSNKVGILDILKDNLKTLSDVEEFNRLWKSLGLDVKDCKWIKIGDIYYYSYEKNGERLSFWITWYKSDSYLIIPRDNTFSPFGDDRKGLRSYAKKVADVLNMKIRVVKDPDGWFPPEYRLKFK